MLQRTPRIVFRAIVILVALMLLQTRQAAAQAIPPRAPGLGLAFPGRGVHIGITVRDVDPETAERLKLSGGAVVEEVQPGMPAEQAGFRKGDIILDFDGERIRSARQLSRVVDETAPNRSVRATILRDGQRTELTVSPSPQPTLDGRRRERLDDLVGSRGRLGVTVTDVTPQLADYFGAKQGVLVTAVTGNSAAAQAGIKTGDVIETVDGQAVRSRQDLIRAVGSVTSGGTVRLGIVRDKKESTIDVKLDG
jgi:serine protease Do